MPPTELLPCPWCGHVGLDFSEGSTFRWRIAECANCGASTGEERIQTLGEGTREEWEANVRERLIAAWNRRAPPVGHLTASTDKDRSVWISVDARLPQPGVTVLAYYVNRLNNGRRIRAVWIPSKFEEAAPEQDFAEYDEEKDCYFTPEGWYEQIDNWGDYTAVAVCEGTVSHWQPLPAPPALVSPAAAGRQDEQASQTSGGKT